VIALAEYNLFLVAIALRSYIDLTALYSVIVIGSLVGIKLINFADDRDK